ncbi:MAG: DNA polymerase III subunit epsilon [Proteobacteria bacterium]|nr:DNA polymerase III subunit epsilon [Pseudomonadota bacterium]
MRQIILDTETTGLEPSQGHRIIEIGCVELVDRRKTGNTFHYYLQPDRAIDPGASEVHGITDEQLVGKPRFSDVVDKFVEFVRGAELVIHNAAFDIGFLNHELALLGAERGAITDHCTVSCTLQLARSLHTGQKNNLDSLCKRYSVDNSQRAYHGALLDAEILAEVYLAMTGGQASLLSDAAHFTAQAQTLRRVSSKRAPLPVVHATAEETAAHEERLQAIDKASGGNCMWNK